MGNNLVQNLTKNSGTLSKSDHQSEASKPVFYITDYRVRCEENLWIFVLWGQIMAILKLISCKIEKRL